ncbi:Hypothetical protein MVR_LOCUS189 [uncultured virus]|nr:Hypothetical protein MVR_LOCUS189 [uncultured virus]
MTTSTMYRDMLTNLIMSNSNIDQVQEYITTKGLSIKSKTLKAMLLECCHNYFRPSVVSKIQSKMSDDAFMTEYIEKLLQKFRKDIYQYCKANQAATVKQPHTPLNSYTKLPSETSYIRDEDYEQPIKDINYADILSSMGLVTQQPQQLKLESISVKKPMSKHQSNDHVNTTSASTLSNVSPSDMAKMTLPPDTDDDVFVKPKSSYPRQYDNQTSTANSTSPSLSIDSNQLEQLKIQLFNQVYSEVIAKVNSEVIPYIIDSLMQTGKPHESQISNGQHGNGYHNPDHHSNGHHDTSNDRY